MDQFTNLIMGWETSYSKFQSKVQGDQSFITPKHDFLDIIFKLISKKL